MKEFFPIFTATMSTLYSIAIHLLYFTILIASLFNRKARQWINGRKGWRTRLKQWQQKGSSTLWFHAASLGEFEQGLPVMKSIKALLPGCRLVLTFYSPSGYEIRKNNKDADLICYLPLDTPYNARTFINLIQPDAAFFIKYEFWYSYLNQLHHKGVPSFLISGIFRPEQVFFLWYGNWFREKLRYFTYFFVQDRISSTLLDAIGILNVTIAGDTRFDRVLENAASAERIALAENFIGNSFCVVAGSTWPADEDILAAFISKSGPDMKLIIAPHEIDDGHINHLKTLFEGKYARYSSSDSINVNRKQVLIIDNIGMLSSLYQYGQLAYIGGGFGKGIHNILEAAVFGIPVIFGPNYYKSREAAEMIESGCAFAVRSTEELSEVIIKLKNNAEIYRHASLKTKEYVKNNAGVTVNITRQVIKMINNKHFTTTC
jgi:3-deoxy-D-manno-octulosonic-acid transferase